MKPKESEGDEMGNNNELRDNGNDGGMDVDSDEGGGMNVDSVPRSDNIPAFDGCSSGITEDISGDKPVDIYQKFITDNMIQLIERQTFMGITRLTVASTFFSSILALWPTASFDVS